MCEGALKTIRDSVGGRKLKGAMDYVRDLEERDKRRRANRGMNVVSEDEENDPNRPVYNPNLLIKAREALFLQNRSNILHLRLTALRSKSCRGGPDKKSICPETFLNVVADKLANTAVMFINIELLAEFFYQFPREIDSRLGYEIDRTEISRFARENPSIKRHLDLQDRKQKLELVMDKLDSLVKLQQENQSSSSSSGFGGRRGGGFGGPIPSGEERKGLFGLF